MKSLLENADTRRHRLLSIVLITVLGATATLSQTPVAFGARKQVVPLQFRGPWAVATVSDPRTNGNVLWPTGPVTINISSQRVQFAGLCNDAYGIASYERSVLNVQLIRTAVLCHDRSMLLEEAVLGIFTHAPTLQRVKDELQVRLGARTLVAVRPIRWTEPLSFSRSLVRLPFSGSDSNWQLTRMNLGSPTDYPLPATPILIHISKGTFILSSACPDVAGTLLRAPAGDVTGLQLADQPGCRGGVECLVSDEMTATPAIEIGLVDENTLVIRWQPNDESLWTRVRS